MKSCRPPDSRYNAFEDSMITNHMQDKTDQVKIWLPCRTINDTEKMGCSLPIVRIGETIDVLYQHLWHFMGSILTNSWILLCMRPTNEKRRHIVTSSLIGWAHKQNGPYQLFRIHMLYNTDIKASSFWQESLIAPRCIYPRQHVGGGWYCNAIRRYQV